jgi:peptide/nickel transport system permease protein
VTSLLQRAGGYARTFASQKVALAAAIVLFGFIAIALLAPVLALPDPMAMRATPYLQPSSEHPLGTDNLGRDVLSRIVWGARLALQVAIISAGLSTLLGIILGSIAGYFGGWLDDVLGRAFDVFLLIPTFFLVILIVALFGSNVYLIMIAIAISTWPRSARIMRAQVLTLKARAFVQATIAAGASNAHVLLFHIIPNGVAPVITNATILMGLAILTEAGLSFLGLGDPNTVSWGRMIFDAQRQLRLAPLLSVFPGLAMLLLVCSLNFIGDGINHTLKPQRRSVGEPADGLGRLPKTVAGVTTIVQPDSVPAPAGPGLLDVRDLRVYYRLTQDWVRAVDGVTFRIDKGGSLGIVGESGSGKSSLGMALMGVSPANAAITGGEVDFGGRPIIRAGRSDLRTVRWKRMAMIFQSAMNALNPVLTVGRQLAESYRLHRPTASKREVAERLAEVFDLVGIPRSRMSSYPHELSGGMRQRVMIALGLLLEPELIIADEPTTALDVLVQDQILAKIDDLRDRMNLGLMLISHDVATVEETCDRVAVMYAGELVEQGPTREVFARPRHPYTHALTQAVPKVYGPRHALATLPGEPFVPVGEPRGCRFAPRCAFATDMCRDEAPASLTVGQDHLAACHYALELDLGEGVGRRRPEVASKGAAS